jgi:predicted dehydrogenase
MTDEQGKKDAAVPGRRQFLRQAGVAAGFLGLGALPADASDAVAQAREALAAQPEARGDSVMGLQHQPIERVRVALLGLGMRGYGQLQVLSKVPNEKFDVVALCDIREQETEKAASYARRKGFKPASYSGSATAWQEMLKRDDIDLVIISTPWEDHVPMSVYAMQQGVHVAVEVPAAYTLDDCWALVNTAEETQRNCMMLENVCYGEEELWLLNMVAHGVFGELTHAEAAYIHQLRDLLFSTDGYYQQWRLKHHQKYTGNLYPTHGLGPVAQYMDIHRGDSFDYLVSMSSPEVGLTAHAKTVGTDNPFHNASQFAHGDMSNQLIKTAKGCTILLQHDVVTHRPYSRINALGGSKAFHTGYPSRMAAPQYSSTLFGSDHDWLSSRAYKKLKKKFQHELWRKKGKDASRAGGHGGMDYLMLYRLIDNMNRGAVWDMDVYDGVAWSVITPLSQLSEQYGSAPMKFPDFTRGKWQQSRQLPVMEVQ